MNGKAMYNLTYGLFVLTAKDGAKDNGCIVNTVSQVTTEPNRICVAVNKLNFTHDMIHKTGEFNVSILTEGSKFETYKHFGFQSGRNVDKFADFVDAKEAANGIPYITKGANAYLSCQVKQSLDLGTHTLFLAEVIDGEILSDQPSITYTYYQANVKPKPQKVEEKKAGKVWVCKICGYEYDEEEEGVPFEDLPADWTCPWCKHGKQDFELKA